MSGQKSSRLFAPALAQRLDPRERDPPTRGRSFRLTQGEPSMYAGPRKKTAKPRGLSPIVATVLIGTALSCGGSPGSDVDLVSRAEAFQNFSKDGQVDSARALMAPDARQWWNELKGEGVPWELSADALGPWALWDQKLNSQKTVLERTVDGNAVSVMVRETNDYFLLLERGWVVTEVKYFFDDAGRIEGRLIRATGQRPSGRTGGFLSWAQEHEPTEIAELMPGGQVDPSGDHPERFRALLLRWREDTGLPPIV